MYCRGRIRQFNTPYWQSSPLETTLSQMHPFHILNVHLIRLPACTRGPFQLRGLFKILAKENILQCRVVFPEGCHLAAAAACLLCTFTATICTWSQTPPSVTWGRNWSTTKDLCTVTSEVTWNYTSPCGCARCSTSNFHPIWEERKLLSDMSSVTAQSHNGMLQ
jgi:hypothetical protein